MLREYLYVDVTRVRSLLAQLDDGVVESVVSKHTRGTSLAFGAQLLGLSGSAGSRNDRGSEESKSLQDLIFSIWEEAAQAEGLIRDLDPEELSDPDRWTSSEVHTSLAEGEIVRAFLPLGIVDPLYVSARLERFVELNNALSEMTSAGIDEQLGALEHAGKAQIEQEAQVAADGGANRDRLKSVRRKAEAELKASLDAVRSGLATDALEPVSPQMLAIMKVINAFVSSDAISVRLLACGDGRPELGFAGTLLGRDEYIQREREALFSRYGSVLQGWTALLQIAAIPDEASADVARSRDFSSVDLTLGSSINRAAFEQTAIQLLGMLEALGVSEGPLWPSVSVIPLAIYRVIPRSDQSAGIDAASSD